MAQPNGGVGKSDSNMTVQNDTGADDGSKPSTLIIQNMLEVGHGSNLKK